jgi:hypothetical protein
MAVLLGLALGSLTMLLAVVVGCALLLRAVGVVQAVLDDAQPKSKQRRLRFKRFSIRRSPRRQSHGLH